jgi:hypothetical protein
MEQGNLVAHLIPPARFGQIFALDINMKKLAGKNGVSNQSARIMRNFEYSGEDKVGWCVHIDIKGRKRKRKLPKPQVDRTASHPPQLPDCRASHAARHVVFVWVWV